MVFKKNNRKKKDQSSAFSLNASIESSSDSDSASGHIFVNFVPSKLNPAIKPLCPKTNPTIGFELIPGKQHFRALFTFFEKKFEGVGPFGIFFDFQHKKG